MENFKSLYFIGIGGIGMSNLARYFLAKGYRIGGYDRTPSDITHALSQEGAEIFYEEKASSIPEVFRDKSNTLIVYTPAVPESHEGLCFFRDKGFTVVKRAQLLGMITRSSKGLCFAGTHGKTTTSSMAAHILAQSPIGCNAFLGGILKNYNSNLILSDTSEYSVIEADEYDRSFHQLNPWIAVITATDSDHLDIYGTEEAYLESFRHFTTLIHPGGALIIKNGLKLNPEVQNGVKIYHYSGENNGDFHAKNIRIGNGTIVFDFVTPEGVITDIELGVPVKINIENSVAAMAVAWLCGVSSTGLRRAMASFEGAKRRFDFWLKTDDKVMIDDYAHHPDELKASILSVKALYPGRKITGIFQPHLFSRTRDFYKQFAKALSMLDEVILLDIYPAREKPIPGITSQLIFNEITTSNKILCTKETLFETLKTRNFEVLITLGAGDIDRLLPDIKACLENR